MGKHEAESEPKKSIQREAPWCKVPLELVDHQDKTGRLDCDMSFTRVYAHIDHLAGKRGYWYDRQHDLAEKCGVSFTQLKRALKWLRENGFIEATSLGAKYNNICCYNILARTVSVTPIPEPDNDEEITDEEQNDSGSSNLGYPKFEPGASPNLEHPVAQIWASHSICNRSSPTDLHPQRGCVETHPEPPPLEEKPGRKAKVTPVYTEEAPEYQLAAYLRARILQRDSRRQVPKTVAAMQKWAEHIAFLMHSRKFTFDEIKDVISFCQDDDFWRSNILSTASLRAKFDRLQEQFHSRQSREASHERSYSHRSGQKDKATKGRASNEVDGYIADFCWELAD